MTTVTEPTVTVGVDGSAASLQAVRWAVVEAAARGAEVRLVHAFHPPVMAGIAMSPVVDAGKQWSEQLLDEAAAIVAELDPRLTTSRIAAMDSPVRLLLDQSRHSQLTVVGTKGSSRLGEALFGAVAPRIAGHVRGAVLVVRAEQAAPTGDLPTVLVCLDGSAGSEHAAAFAFDEAALHAAELVAVRTWDDAPVAQGLRAYPLDIDLDSVDAAEAVALAEQVRPWRDKYPEVPVRELVRRGRPAAAVGTLTAELTAASGPGMVVSSSRGRGELAGLVLGSTGQSLIARADWPTVVVTAE